MQLHRIWIGSMRIDIHVGGERVFTEALHRGRSWFWSPGEGVIEGSEQGRSIILGAMEYEDGSIGWDCTGGTVELKHRPSQCRPVN